MGSRPHVYLDVVGLVLHRVRHRRLRSPDPRLVGSDHGVQSLSVAYSEHLATLGIKPSTGAVGSSYDNALAESVIGLYKTELIKPKRPWKGLDDLEIATAEWIDWLNRRRPFEYCDDLTPVEAEQAHYAHHQTPTPVGVSNSKVSELAGAVQTWWRPVWGLAMDEEVVPALHVEDAARAVAWYGRLAFVRSGSSISSLAFCCSFPWHVEMSGSICRSTRATLDPTS